MSIFIKTLFIAVVMHFIICLHAVNKTAMWFSYGNHNSTQLSIDANFITQKHRNSITHMVLGCQFFVCGYENVTQWGNINECLDAIQIYKKSQIIIYNDLSKGGCGIQGEREFLSNPNITIPLLITIANKYGFDGWNFDLEASGSNASDNVLLTNFLTEAYEQFNEENLDIVIDVGPTLTEPVTPYVQYAKFMTMQTYHTGNEMKTEEHYLNESGNYSSH
eukprot:270570_1